MPNTVHSDNRAANALLTAGLTFKPKQEATAAGSFGTLGKCQEMNRRTKIITGVSVFVLAAIILLLVNGFHAMNIEDHYGDLQTVYYRAEDGDVIIDNQNRYGFLKKFSSRIFVEEDDCMRDLSSWVHRSEPPVKFSVYRLAVDETWITSPSYPQMQRLIREQNLKPIIGN